MDPGVSSVRGAAAQPFLTLVSCFIIIVVVDDDVLVVVVVVVKHSCFWMDARVGGRGQGKPAGALLVKAFLSL